MKINTLKAIATKLSQQKLQLYEQLQRVAQDIQHINTQLDDVYSILDKLQKNNHFIAINPEIEINRLNYISQNYQRIHDLKNTLAHYTQAYTVLTNQQQGVQSEIKMLALYQEKEQKKIVKKKQRAYQNYLDNAVAHHKDFR